MGAFYTVENLPVLGLGPRALHRPHTCATTESYLHSDGRPWEVSCAVVQKTDKSGRGSLDQHWDRGSALKWPS